MGCRNSAWGGHGDVEVFRVNDDVRNRAGYFSHPAADDLDFDAVGQDYFRDGPALHVPVAGRHHFVGFGQIGPQLKAVHHSLGVPLGHFLVDDPTARGHPLDVAGGDNALIAHAVAVLHVAFEHVGDGLDAPVRMPGEPLEIVLRPVIAKIVQEQKGVELRHFAEAEDPLEMHPGPFEGGFGLQDLADISGGCHGGSPWHLGRE